MYVSDETTHHCSIMVAANGADMESLDGRDSIGYDVMGRQTVYLSAPSKPTIYGRDNAGANSGIVTGSNLSVQDGSRDSI
jgi:hypothetical protein